VRTGVIGRNECVSWIGRTEGVLVNQNYGRGIREKICAEPIGVPNFNKGQPVQEGCCHEEKEYTILKKMEPTHPTQHHLSADYTFQQHCCQNSNIIFTRQIKNCREF
jgi:hypothetical protein